MLRLSRAGGLRALWLCGALSLAFVPVVSSAQRRVEVYKMKYRTAEELLPIVQTVLAGSGSAAVDRGTNSLVLMGDPAAVGDALDFLAGQDRRLRTVVLHYDTKRTRDLEAQGFDVRWNVEAGDFRIGNVRRPPGAGSSVAVNVEGADRHSDQSFSGLVRVMEGETGRIEMGETRPFATSNGFQGTNTQFVTASTGFEAKPRILGDGSVQVELAPFSGRFGRGGKIDSMGASTIVTVEPGETVAVGGIDQSNESSRQDAFRGARDEQSRDDRVLLLRVEVE
jgi:type II secretory pathway component GspD/PulD (secretin)